MNSKILLPKTKHFLLWLLSAFVLIGVTMFVGFKAVNLYQVQTRILEQVNEMENRAAKRPVTKISKTQQDEQKQWELLEKEKQYPWKHLFAAIETSTDKQIELLELLPDKASRLVILRGEATNTASLVAFLEKLENNSNLRTVHLSHQEKVTRERLETLGFEIKITLR